MDCHICGKPMRVVRVEQIGQFNAVVQNTVETWRCNDCDRWWRILLRFLHLGK